MNTERFDLLLEFVGYTVACIMLSFWLDVHYTVSVIFGGLLYFGIRLLIAVLSRLWRKPQAGQWWKRNGDWGEWR